MDSLWAIGAVLGTIRVTWLFVIGVLDDYYGEKHAKAKMLEMEDVLLHRTLDVQLVPADLSAGTGDKTMDL